MIFSELSWLLGVDPGEIAIIDAPAQPPALPLVALLVIGVTVTTIVIIVVWLGRKTR